MITGRMVTTETKQTTISDHFTVTAKIPANWKECTNMNIPLVRNFKKIKRDNALTFLFYLDQKLRKMNVTSDVNAQMERLSETIMASVDHFAPEKPWIGRSKSDDWITNKVENAINKRNQLFQLWVKHPTELNRINYKTSRNRVTRMIRSEKKKPITKN